MGLALQRDNTSDREEKSVNSPRFGLADRSVREQDLSYVLLSRFRLSHEDHYEAEVRFQKAIERGDLSLEDFTYRPDGDSGKTFFMNPYLIRAHSEQSSKYSLVVFDRSKCDEEVAKFALDYQPNTDKKGYEEESSPEAEITLFGLRRFAQYASSFL